MVFPVDFGSNEGFTHVAAAKQLKKKQLSFADLRKLSAAAVISGVSKIEVVPLPGKQRQIH